MQRAQAKKGCEDGGRAQRGCRQRVIPRSCTTKIGCRRSASRFFSRDENWKARPTLDSIE